MSYTKEDIPEMIKCFKAARENIANCKNSYICFALEGTGADLIQKKCRTLIREALEDESNLLVWLEEKYPGMDFSPGDWRELRLRWIDKIVGDLQEYAK